MELTKATAADLTDVVSLYQRVTEEMNAEGLDCWRWGEWPSEEILRKETEAGRLYIQRDEDTLAAAIVLKKEQDPEYETASWTCGIRPGALHLLAVNPAIQGSGWGGGVLDDALQLLRRAGCDCVRIDTDSRNKRAIRLYEKMGFRFCGELSRTGFSHPFRCYDKPLKRETPLLPIRMTPAFRGGALTPWGGERLKTIWGKDLQEIPTGESLEVSCIPGLESRDPQGRTLTELVREFGEKIVGHFADKPFPLLLKLIDAREKLSVQVHPDDTYAETRDDGKLGKSEAWLVLDAPPKGGELVYGIRPGTTLQELEDACKAGKAVEKLLNRVKVNPGDVCYIPAGCVHSVGAGVLLYEIQEASDLTYRLYDWNRTDENGNRRELHIGKALDVTDLRCAPTPRRVEKSFGVKRVVSEDRFTLDLIRTHGIEMLPAVHGFRILTVTEGEMELRFAGGSVRMKAGETCLIPCNSPELALVGPGTAALAMPV